MNITDKNANLWVLAQDAVSTTYILDLLGIDDGYCDYDYLYRDKTMAERYETMLHYFGAENSFNIAGIGKDERYGENGTIMSVHELLAESSLISIDIGMGDVFNRTRGLFAASGLKIDLENTENIAAIVEKVTDLFFEGYGLWLKNFPRILEYLKTNKQPDTPVVVIGAFNPIYNLVLTDEYLVPVGNALSLITTLMNAQYKKWAEEYGFVFVDVSNVDTGAATSTISLPELLSYGMGVSTFAGNATHPTPEGYQQMARMIVEELKKLEGAAQEAKTTIKLDLGSTTNVQYVLVDGHRVAYSFEDHVLTIKYGNPFADVLTVASKDANGKVRLAVYHLSYNDGYTAFRTYVANDFIGIIRTTLNSIFSIIRDAFARFLGK